MASQIKLKRSSVPGNSPTFGTEIVEGELALNTADQKLYSANSTATFTLATGTSSTASANSDQINIDGGRADSDFSVLPTIIIDGGTSVTTSYLGSSPLKNVFYENSANVTSSYTISANRNAMSAGPITIDSGVTVTIPSNSVWTIV
jgi:hypothetical protein